MILVAGHALVSESARRLCHEAELGIIRYSDSVCFGLVGQDRKNRTKDFFSRNFHLGLDVGKGRRLDEVSAFRREGQAC